MDKHHKFMNQAIVAPSVGAMIDKLALHPLDTVILFQQSKQMDLLQSARYIQQHYGISGYYKGLSTKLVLASMPAQVMVYGSYSGAKYLLGQHSSLNNTKQQLASSAITGMIASPVFCALEAKRARDTCQLSEHFKWRANVVFRGFVPVFFKGLLHPTVALAGADALKPYTQAFDRNGFTAGLISGSLAQVFTTPLDVAKTKMMTDYDQPRPSFVEKLQHCYRENQLFNSLGSRAIRLGLNNSVIIGTMAFVNQQMNLSKFT